MKAVSNCAFSVVEVNIIFVVVGLVVVGVNGVVLLDADVVLLCFSSCVRA